MCFPFGGSTERQCVRQRHGRWCMRRGPRKARWQGGVQECERRALSAVRGCEAPGKYGEGTSPLLEVEVFRAEGRGRELPSVPGRGPGRTQAGMWGAGSGGLKATLGSHTKAGLWRALRGVIYPGDNETNTGSQESRVKTKHRAAAGGRCAGRVEPVTMVTVRRPGSGLQRKEKPPKKQAFGDVAAGATHRL